MKYILLITAAIAAVAIAWSTLGSDPVAASHDNAQQSKVQATQQTPNDGPLSLTFGVYRTDKATTMYRTFLPVVEAIQEDLGARLGRSVDIELKIYKTYDEGLAAIVEGTSDFVRFGPASYVLAKQRQPKLFLLAMEHKRGKKRFQGVIAVRKNDPAKTLKDLKGRTFAFGDQNSTIGRYLSQAEMIRDGIRGSDLKSFSFLGRHDAVAMAVKLGDFDAGALKSSTFEKMNKAGKLRKLHTFDNVTKPWVARAGLDPKVQAAIRAALLALDDKEVCAPLKIDGWLPASDDEYEFVREGMKLAREEFEPKIAKR